MKKLWLIPAVLLLALLSSCMYIAPDPAGLEVTKALDSALNSEKSRGTTTIDLGSLVPTKWDRLVVACYGVTPKQLDDALGFPWNRSVETTRSNFLAFLVFTRGSSVVDYVDIGENDFVVDINFIPCPLASGGAPQTEPPLTLTRAESAIPFTYSSANKYWFISKDDYEGLLRG